MGLMSIRQITCGENHTLALVDMVVVDESKDGGSDEPMFTTKLFVWGANDKRQLGMSTDPISPTTCEDSVTSGNADCQSSGAGGGSTTTINQDLKVPH